MINVLRMSLKIDMTAAINSFIYVLKRMPIFKHIINDGVYSTRLKAVVRILGIILSTLRMIIYRALYFGVIYYLASALKGSTSLNFIHIYFVFTIIGLFINNKLLNTSTRKYYSLVLFNMDAKEYTMYELFWILSTSFVLNLGFLLLMSHLLNFSMVMAIVLSLFGIFARVIGEAFNIWFYKNKGYIWTYNYPLFFSILIGLLIVSFLPAIKFTFNNTVIFSVVLVSAVLAIISFVYLKKVPDYKIIFKRLNTLKAALNHEKGAAYQRQNMVMIRDKDKVIDKKKYEGKKGYDLFNTIFFERHKEILLRSARNYSIVMGIVFVVGIGLIMLGKMSGDNVRDLILNRLGIFVFIMYFVNRGSIVTQAMFYNCDHAMLKYNFYREPDVIVGLFKKRLMLTVNINLFPAVILALGTVILILVTGGTALINYVIIFLFIIILSVFFSVHYLVIYYLLQPYNEKMEMKKVSYTIVSLVTYLVAYTLNDIRMPSLYFSLIGLLFTVGYIVVGLRLVYKKAPKTFKLN